MPTSHNQRYTVDTSTLPHLNRGANPFVDGKIGCNPIALHRLLAQLRQSGSDEDLAGIHNFGIDHWPALAAARGGVLPLAYDHKVDREDRSYTVAPFPVQGVPKPLRPAFTAAAPGHALIELDWRASVWQILAFRSGDTTLIDDLRSGDLYTDHFPGPWTRDQAKAATNATINGGGMPAMLDVFGDAAAAQAYRDRAQHLLTTRWPRANAYQLRLRDEAVKRGWTGAGIPLMRIEAECLRRACTASSKLAMMGMRVVMSMHDGVLVSAPTEVADRVAVGMAKSMTLQSTGSPDEIAHHDRWVKYTVSSSWRGNDPQLVGDDLRTAALRACAAGSCDPADLVMAAAAVPDALTAASTRYHHATSNRRAMRAAREAVDAAVQWFDRATERRAAKTAPDDRVPLPNRDGSYTNMCRILRDDVRLPTPRWNVRESAIYVDGVELTDTALRQTYLTAIETRYQLRRPSVATLVDAVTDVARENEYDPVRDYFDGLRWDGVPRLQSWLRDYANAVDPIKIVGGLVDVYATKWMLSVVARAYEPGCKVDTMLVLMGEQGARKSSLLRAIAPCESFAAVQIDPADKDSVLRASKVAIVEWPELAGASRREQEALKDYFSLHEDRVRPPYGRGDLRIPRRTVFAATTNEDDFLRDATGSRRYWPVRVGQIDIDGIIAVRDQLWAEAVDLYRLPVDARGDHDRWWLSPQQEEARAKQAEEFSAEDPLRPKVWAYVLAQGGTVTLDGVLDHLEVRPTDRARMGRPVAVALRALGLVSKSVRDGKVVHRRWVHPGANQMTATSLPDLSDLIN